MTTLFLGLALDTTVTNALSDALRPVWAEGHDVAWTRPGGWHVTLAYLGEATTPVADVAAIAAGVLAGESRPSLALGGTATWFDRAGVAPIDDPEDWCVAAGDALQQAVADAGLPVVRREVAAHVTLCRRRGSRDDGRGTSLTAQRLAAALADVRETWQPDVVSVFTSVTGDGPASYPVVASVPVGSAAC